MVRPRGRSGFPDCPLFLSPEGGELVKERRSEPDAFDVTARVPEHRILQSAVPDGPAPAVPKPIPYSFLSSRTICSLFEVGNFKLGNAADSPLTDENVAEFVQQTKDIKYAAAFIAATSDDQKNAVNLLAKAGFRSIATWPGNACRQVTLWLLVKRTRPKKRR